MTFAGHSIFVYGLLINKPTAPHARLRITPASETPFSASDDSSDYPYFSTLQNLTTSDSKRKFFFISSDNRPYSAW